MLRLFFDLVTLFFRSMKRSEILLMVLQIPVDLLLLVLAGISAYALRFAPWIVSLRPVIFQLSFEEYLSIVTLVAFGWIMIFAFVGLYSVDPNRKLLRDLHKVLSGTLMGLACIAVFIMFTQEIFDSRFLVAVGWFFALVYVSLGRVLMRGLKGLLYRAGIGARRVIVIGTEGKGADIIRALSGRRELGYAVVGEYHHFTPEVAAALSVARPDEVIFTNPRANQTETLRAIDFCNAQHITFKYSADLFDTYSSRIAVYPLAGVPIVELKRTPLDGWGRVAKRVFDVVMSLVVLVLASPLMLAASLIIFFETGRPVIYKNERVGLRGQRFFAYKFRSMYQKDSTWPQFAGQEERTSRAEQAIIAEKNSRTGPIYKITDDPRVTPFGRFIRRWSLDELPQFLNVIGGAMSIVGPRPHQPREVAGYEKPHLTALTLKPGVTGLAQISGRSDLSYEDEMKLDIFYIEQWSLPMDLIIFFKTPLIIFKRRKAL